MSRFVHSLFTFELNSVSYEEIVIASLKGLESIFPVNGMVVAKVGLLSKPGRFAAAGTCAVVPTPSRYARRRDNFVIE